MDAPSEVHGRGRILAGVLLGHEVLCCAVMNCITEGLTADSMLRILGDKTPAGHKA